MMSLTCAMCKNYTYDGKCKAFPKGVDVSVATGKNDHSKPLKGQKNTIVFEPIENDET